MAFHSSSPGGFISKARWLPMVAGSPGGFPVFPCPPSAGNDPWREALRVRVAEAWRKLRGKVLGQYCSRKPEADACIAVPPHGSSSGRVFFKCPMSIKFLKMFKEKYIAHLHPKPRAAFTRISGAIYSQKIRARRQTQVAVP